METRQIGWNGLRFWAPANCRPVKIGRRHLHFADPTGPVMELAWQRAGKRFSPTGWVKKSREVDLAPLDASWAQALSGFEVLGIKAKKPTTGRGVLAYCPGCGTATVFLFYGMAGKKAGKVLASFSDHPRGGEVSWSLFDICARVPVSMELDSYRFLPGEFMLAFSGGGTDLCLWRWSPASMLLVDQSLAGWVKQRLPGADTLPDNADFNGRIYWEQPPPASAGRRLMRRLSSRPLHTLGRAWLVEGKNRILAATAQGARLDTGAVSKVFDSYGIAG
ncbi:MAG: hypothetical protein JRI97_10070 [Deltaproteobacteria bacterium]|nr:hypothetical protein [Deltaproteobacteria bacterium]